MKIWHIDPVNMTPYYNSAICSALSDQGHEVRYVTSKFLYDTHLVYPSNVDIDIHYFRHLENRILLRFPRVRQGLRALSYPLSHYTLAQKIRHEKPDIVHFQWSRLPIFDLWLVRKIRSYGIPVVHTIHDVQPLFSQEKYTGRVEAVYKEVNACILLTQKGFNEFLMTYPSISANQLHITRLIAMNDTLMPEHADRVTARNQLNVPLDQQIILFFGTIKSYKGVDILVQAFQNIADQIPQAQLWIVGHPDSEKQEQSLREYEAHPRIFVHPQFVPSNDAWKYHLAADLIVFPYRHIFQSAALITALNYQRPVIVTDVGALAESVDGNGWILPPENPDALARTLVEAFSDMARLEHMGRRSKQIIDEHYAPDAIAKQLLAIYIDLISGTKE
jgi:glycosyltransferase involved in cell wall biosynthesis